MRKDDDKTFRRHILIDVPRRVIWWQVTSIGGDNRFWYMNALWYIRESMDRCVAGPWLHPWLGPACRYVLVPAHLFIFKGFTAAIARREEKQYGLAQPDGR
jgi:hypothetical protein